MTDGRVDATPGAPLDASMPGAAGTRVSVVVPSIGTRRTVRGEERTLVVECVRSVLASRCGIAVEVLVVAGREMPEDVIDALVALAAAAAADGVAAGVADGVATVRIVRDDRPFNFSTAVNLGAAHATGTHLLFLNDDTEVVTADWLVRMLDALGHPAVMPDGAEVPVGAVGARLLFADGRLQHAGHTYRTSLDHVAFGYPGDSRGRDGLLLRRRAVAGVTAACLLLPWSVFELVGGFSPLFAGNYNDVDLCLKIRAGGYAVVYEPAAVLHHYESQSRVATVCPEEIAAIQRRWLSRLVDDPFTPVTI